MNKLKKKNKVENLLILFCVINFCVLLYSCSFDIEAENILAIEHIRRFEPSSLYVVSNYTKALIEKKFENEILPIYEKLDLVNDSGNIFSKKVKIKPNEPSFSYDLESESKKSETFNDELIKSLELPIDPFESELSLEKNPEEESERISKNQSLDLPSIGSVIEPEEAKKIDNEKIQQLIPISIPKENIPLENNYFDDIMDLLDTPTNNELPEEKSNEEEPSIGIDLDLPPSIDEIIPEKEEELSEEDSDDEEEKLNFKTIEEELGRDLLKENPYDNKQIKDIEGTKNNFKKEKIKLKSLLEKLRSRYYEDLSSSSLSLTKINKYHNNKILKNKKNTSNKVVSELTSIINDINSSLKLQKGEYNDICNKIESITSNSSELDDNKVFEFLQEIKVLLSNVREERKVKK